MKQAAQHERNHHVEKMPNGRWLVSVETPTGLRPIVDFTTKPEAERFVRILQGDER